MFEELVESKINFLYGHIKKQTTTAITFYSSQLPIDFDDKYKFLKGNPSPFNIYSFEQIGMCDPYPLEESSRIFEVPKNTMKLVYP